MGTSSWLEQVNWAPSKGGSTRLHQLIKAESSHIVEINLPLVDLSDGNLTTLKSPPKHHGISPKEESISSSSHKPTPKVSSFGPYSIQLWNPQVQKLSRIIIIPPERQIEGREIHFTCCLPQRLRIT